MFISPEDSEMGILCLECRHFNPPDSRLCRNCQKELLMLSEKPPKLEKAYWALAEKTFYFKAGKLSLREYWDFLINRLVFFETQLKEVEALPIPPEFKKEMEEELSTGKTGIKHFMEAIKILQEFCETKNPVFAEQGLSLAKTASELLNRALAINWGSFLALKKSAEEFIARQQDNI